MLITIQTSDEQDSILEDMASENGESKDEFLYNKIIGHINHITSSGESFAEIVSRERKLRSFTRTQMAKLVGSSRVWWGRWENGQSVPKKDRVIHIAKVLGIDPVQLGMAAGYMLSRNEGADQANMVE